MAESGAFPVGNGTSPIVSQNATKRDEIRLDQVQLVGIMGKPDDMTALFRMTRGNILRVKAGDQSQIGRIYEISGAGVVVTRSNGNSIFIPPIPVG
jgi:Tfp pilus assembly protein PilP